MFLSHIQQQVNCFHRPILYMDVPVNSSEKVLEPPRRRHGRDIMLSVKEVVFSSRDSTFDDLFNATSIAQRGLRGKLRQTFPKNRSRDTSNIVLGPQKRTWNTGCHVNHALVRESNDDIGRGGKSGCDHRGSDKTYNRFTSDLKKDNRGTGRDRGGVRRVDSTSVSRLHRDDRCRESRHPIDEEPEWFSEGPTTVTETIELGRVLEALEDEPDVQRKQFDPSHPASTVDPNPAGKVVQSTFPISTETKATSCLTSPLVFESPSSTNICPPTESQGSRFRHLFNEPTTTTSNTKPGSVNNQLLQLLKGCNHPTSSTSPEKSNVIQVENKLRSILLGHSLPRQPVNTVVNSEPNSSKPQILTVEEIESCLRLGSNSPSTAVASHTHFPCQSNSELTENPSSNPAQLPQSIGSSDISGCRSNLVPIFQSLTSKQPPQPACPRPLRLSSINLSTPITQPQTTSTVSADYGIQRQQMDYPASVTRDGTYQGVLRQIWDNTHLSNPHKILQTPNTFVQRTTCGLPGYVPDLSSRPGLCLNQPYIIHDTNRSVTPRRPIVKAQQSMVNPSIRTLATLASSGSVASQNFTNLDDIDRRLFNLNFKQQPSVCDNTFSTTNSGDLRFSAPGAPLFPNMNPIPLASPNAVAATRIPPNRHNSTNPLSFLSQLIDVNDLGSSVDSPRPSSFSLNLLGSSVKAKTLEEIEHQEVTSGSPFF